MYANATLHGSSPLHVLDLASSTAWVASVDGAAVRPIIVPGGGYNSDLQPLPWIKGEAVRSNVTYTRNLSLPPNVIKQVLRIYADVGGGGGRAAATASGVFIEFGGVAHAAEVYATVGAAAPVLLGRHYGTMMPFSVDVGPVASLLLAGADTTIVLTVVALHYRTVQQYTPAGFIYDEAWEWNETTGAGYVCECQGFPP